MKRESLHDGRADGLVPLESLNLDEVGSFAELLRAMSRTAFSGRQLGEALDVLLAMFRDPSCATVLTLAGAMTVAKQGQMVCDMIDRGLVQAVVGTGALVAHGLTASIGLIHYRYDPSQNDEVLYRRGYNRIYDTLEMEANLNKLQEFVGSVLQNDMPEQGTWSSAQICRALGRRLSELQEGPGILRSAYEQGVPVFIPAFTDSELGLDLALWAMGNSLESQTAPGESPSPEDLFRVVPSFNPFLDLQQYATLMSESERAGIFTIGGGVPRNWAQQVGPYVELVNSRTGAGVRPPRFRYGVRLCPEPAHWGGLSGCTYLEGVSWGKFVPPTEGGRFAEVYCDATAVWPLLMKAVFEELDKRLP
jgi:deoxyhypusine synthase